MSDIMQFRDYIFHHNPSTITVWQPERLVTHFCPGAGEAVQNLGPGSRTARCQGSFFGASYREALVQLERFRAAAGTGEKGILFLPGIAPFFACLKELAFDATGDGKIIPYTMVFQEAGDLI